MKSDLAPRPQLPLCLLDIDGVVALLGHDGAEPTFEATVAGYPVTVAVAARARLSRLARSFRIVWASAWMDEGARVFGPVLGLSADLPFLRFDPDADPEAATYKLPVVRRFVRDRAVAWIDDELGEDVGSWAESRRHPTLLVHTDPRIGLVNDHVEALLAFAAEAQENRRT
jgi:hypothetical protein